MPESKTHISKQEAPKPDLPKRLFWDTKYETIDWEKAYLSIIARVIERGNAVEWEELIRFYGKPRVENALTNEITFLPDYAVEDVCLYFNLKKEQLVCYIRKQSRKGHWI